MVCFWKKNPFRITSKFKGHGIVISSLKTPEMTYFILSFAWETVLMAIRFQTYMSMILQIPHPFVFVLSFIGLPIFFGRLSPPPTPQPPPPPLVENSWFLDLRLDILDRYKCGCIFMHIRKHFACTSAEINNACTGFRCVYTFFVFYCRRIWLYTSEHYKQQKWHSL